MNRTTTDRRKRLIEAELDRQDLTDEGAAREVRLPGNAFRALRNGHRPSVDRGDKKPMFGTHLDPFGVDKPKPMFPAHLDPFGVDKPKVTTRHEDAPSPIRGGSDPHGDWRPTRVHPPHDRSK